MFPAVVLSINCGSSSIKFQLLQDLQPILVGSAKDINSGSQPAIISFDYSPHDKQVRRLSAKRTIELASSTSYQDVFNKILEAILDEDIIGKGEEGKERIYIVAHRIVHGGKETLPVIIKHGDKDEKTIIDHMDSISDFAPLHNHHAMLIVKTCLEALPKATSVLCFDTLFHTSIPDYRTTYAISQPKHETPVPLRKFGFHGLSYDSILTQMKKALSKNVKEVNLVVAHLGSGGSVCLIQGGLSMNTTMGLTPLEGLPGGTRSGSIDPSLIFHHTPDCSETIEWNGKKISKAEWVLNKESGFQALTGTSNFGTIIQKAFDPSSGIEESTASKLAYSLYLSHLTSIISSYLSTLFASPAPFNKLDGLVFSGGIGEKASRLRKDVLQSLAWIEELGQSGGGINEEKNENPVEQCVTRITKEGSLVPAWVVKTDEELICARLASKAVGTI